MVQNLSGMAEIYFRHKQNLIDRLQIVSNRSAEQPSWIVLPKLVQPEKVNQQVQG